MTRLETLGLTALAILSVQLAIAFPGRPPDTVSSYIGL